MFKPLSFTLLMVLIAVADVSAQTATKAPDNFSAIAEGRTVILIDDAGLETKGQVIRITPDQLAVDAAIPERRLIYTKAAGSGKPIAISTFPSLARGQMGLSTRVSS
jgi:hypothetical protein